MTNWVRYIDIDAQDTGGNGKSAALTPDGNGDYAFKSTIVADGCRDSAGQPPADLTGTGGHTLTFTYCSNHANHTAETAGSVSLADWITSATNFITMNTDSASKAGTSWSSSKYRCEYNGAHTVSVPSYTVVDGIQLRQTSATVAYYNAGLAPGKTNITYKNCFMINDFNGSNRCRCVLIDQAGTANFINCIMIARGNLANGTNAVALTTNSSAVLNLYNCTIIGGYLGVLESSGTIVAKNCYVGGGSTTRISSGVAQTTCSASDTSAADAALDSIAYNTTNFVNVTAGSEDLALPLGSALIGVGTDISESAPFNYTTDINGATRTSTWDIGADEYITPPVASFVQEIMCHRSNLYGRGV